MGAVLAIIVPIAICVYNSKKQSKFEKLLLDALPQRNLKKSQSAELSESADPTDLPRLGRRNTSPIRRRLESLDAHYRSIEISVLAFVWFAACYLIHRRCLRKRQDE